VTSLAIDPVVFKNTIARFDIATLKAKALFDDIPSNRARRGPKLRARIVDEIKTVALDWYIGNKQLPGTLAVLCCFSVVIIQQSAQPLAALHRSRYFMSCLDGHDQRISETLMIAFEMIQLDNEIPILAKQE